MFSYVLPSVPSFWRSPRLFEEFAGTEGAQTMVAHCPENTSRPTAPSTLQQPSTSRQSSSEDGKRGSPEIHEILSSSDLYHILGVPRSRNVDSRTLRQAYLSRSKACHPDKFPDNPDATYAFQKVAVAYDVLSKPSSKRKYDSQPPHVQVDVFAFHSTDHADNTLKGVLGSVLCDFLDGNLETVHMLLRAVGDLSPSLELSEESIDSVLSVLRGIRERMLTCRTCVVALHAECIRVLELQSAFRQLPYFDITGRSRLTIQLTRLTITLPITLEKAIQEQRRGANYHQQPTNHDRENQTVVLLPRKVSLLIRGIDLVLARVEQILA
ncbi:DnaJ domain-containing protein [Pisolithus croceorrhizus]|nr:DnaJ domain-containing protein [Pisolithus croceorrhizus]KAI6110528.1 DnaJ domain-containing protein [Pisolithus croceorrhizus]